MFYWNYFHFTILSFVLISVLHYSCNIFLKPKNKTLFPKQLLSLVSLISFAHYIQISVAVSSQFDTTLLFFPSFSFFISFFFLFLFKFLWKLFLFFAFFLITIKWYVYNIFTKMSFFYRNPFRYVCSEHYNFLVF